MTRALVGAAVAGILLGPTVALAGVAVLMNPAAQASCLATSPITVLDVPDSLETTTTDGVRVHLDRTQLMHAATIVGAAERIDGVGPDGAVIALMAALTESGLRMLSNVSAYPTSGRFPNDGDGGDHDSLGLFQMRPSTGWGSVAELMDPAYQARAFFGGPTGPNHGSPRGLLDVPGWRVMPKGAVAQAVEVSAFPDRYVGFEPVAEAIIRALATSPDAAPPGSGRVVVPLPAGSSVRTSGFGMRVHPITGERTLHTGVDFAAPAGTPILAAADGRVAYAGAATGYGNLILIEHTIDAKTLVTGYAHMHSAGIQVHVGDSVTAGQRIATVGSAGDSTGPHLHFELRPGGVDAAPVDPEPWLTGHAAVTVEDAALGAACGGVSATVEAGPATPYLGKDPEQLLDDPTSAGRITARTAHVLAQARANFPAASWSCWSPRPGTRSEHPLGRACDGTFGNSIGTAASGPALDLGWAVTNWLKAHARTLGVEYLIWQGRIWSLARTNQGWRPYGGGGMHDPADITGGHYDHLHFTVVQ